MSMRIFSAASLAFCLAACGGGVDEPDRVNSLAEAEAQARSTAADNGAIECAVGGKPSFTRSCTVEREYKDGELLLTIRHEDGGFRRFRVLKGGRGVVTADGAEPAIWHAVTARAIEVQVAQDRYMLPATVKQKTVATGAPAAPAAKP